MKFNMSDTGATLYSWLTLTWDVLKCMIIPSNRLEERRLTLTWDVLKYFCSMIIWCIKFGLTLTWDVLK